MSQYIQRQWKGFALLLLALGLALPAAARDIVETPAALFFTRDERAGIQMPTPEDGCCLLPYRPGIFGGPINPGGPIDPTTGPFFRVDPDRSGWWAQPDDFTASSVSQFTNLGKEIGREAVQTRLRPFLAAWVYDKNEDELVISDRSLGPTLAERPQTIGEGRFAVGWSYQRLYWDRLNGQKLDSLQFKIEHKDVNGDGRLTGQETDFIMVDVDMKLEQDYVDFYFEWGITNSFDISVAIPLVQTNLEITAFAGNVQQADPNDPNVDLTEPLLDQTFAPFSSENGFPGPGNNDQWGVFHSNRTHMFCEASRNITFRSLRSNPNERGCPGGNDDSVKGDRASSFFGGINDTKNSKDFGIGDVRFRAKWHALRPTEESLLPDLAWVAEIRPPSGQEGDLQGTGAMSTSNYLVGSWRPPQLPEYIDWFSGFRPHANIGVEISTGPDWQDSTAWALGVEAPVPNLYTLVTRGQLRGVDWMNFTFDQLGRIPFDDELVSRRYEWGGGFKIVPTPGAVFYFDFIKPINQNDGLTSELSWRVGGQVEF